MESQLRQHLKHTIFSRARAFRESFRLGNLGHGVYIDKNVEFMRYPKNIYVGDRVVVKEGTKICSCNNKSIIKIGPRTTIGYHTFIFASNGITIGEDCLIAPFVYLVDSNHQTKRDKRINQQPNETSPISIGSDVWISSNVTILKGVNIEDGAIIATNSVVNTDVPKFAIYGGSPARKIGERT